MFDLYKGALHLYIHRCLALLYLSIHQYRVAPFPCSLYSLFGLCQFIKLYHCILFIIIVIVLCTCSHYVGQQ